MKEAKGGLTNSSDISTSMHATSIHLGTKLRLHLHNEGDGLCQVQIVHEVA